MTPTQALLGKVAEECAEIAQRASKAQRFGLTEIQPGQALNNAQRLMDEVHDLKAVLRMLSEISSLDDVIEEHRIPPIIEKVMKYIDYSRELGEIDERPDRMNSMRYALEYVKPILEVIGRNGQCSQGGEQTGNRIHVIEAERIVTRALKQ